MFSNPQHAYRAGFALVDPLSASSAAIDGVIYLRHVHQSGSGTIYSIPSGSVDLQPIVRSVGHGEILGAPVQDVEKAATERRPLQ